MIILGELGFDILSIKPNPNVAKKLARKTFFERGNIIAASEYCLYASTYIVADKFDIPLILQGENAALALGTAMHQEQSDDAFSVGQQNTLRNFDIDDLIAGVEGVSTRDMFWYKIPDISRMKERGFRAVFVQYYAKEWSQVGNADFAIARGLTGRMDEDLHNIERYRRFTALDSDMQIVNQMLKYLKFGFGFATDEACYDIREGRLTRVDAVWYVKEYDGKCGDRYIEMACDYLSLTEKEFWEVVDRFVNRDPFRRGPSGKWVPKFTVGEDYISD